MCIRDSDNTDRIRTALSGSQSAVVLVDDLDQGIAVADAYGAEHLEIHTSDARDVARRIRNAGAIFVGPYAPVPPVSYTHLDVYKRQSQCRRAAAPATITGCLLYTSRCV